MHHLGDRQPRLLERHRYPHADADTGADSHPGAANSRSSCQAHADQYPARYPVRAHPAPVAHHLIAACRRSL